VAGGTKGLIKPRNLCGVFEVLGPEKGLHSLNTMKKRHHAGQTDGVVQKFQGQGCKHTLSRAVLQAMSLKHTEQLLQLGTTITNDRWKLG
jgi:hypothetical protein